MLTMGRTKWMVAGCVASLALLGDARAEFFDFNPGGMGGDHFNPVVGAAGGSSYDWYYQGIAVDFDFGGTDGRQNVYTFMDDPYGSVPYVIFDGTDKSTAGHCLQVAFLPPNSDSQFSNPVRYLRYSYVDSNGNDVAIIGSADVSQGGSYNTARLWIRNTGSGLYWYTKLADMDGNNGAWNQSLIMNIWRLDMNQADCTTNAYMANTLMQFVTIIGTTGNYTVCNQRGECNNGG